MGRLLDLKVWCGWLLGKEPEARLMAWLDVFLKEVREALGGSVG